MPTLSLEITANAAASVDLQDLLKRLVEIVSRADTVDPRAVKAYVHIREIWDVGDGAPVGFASLQLAVLEGRPPELRGKIADDLFTELADSFEEKGFAVTVEIREMDRPSYRKS